ncbi:MAG: 3'-5' exonuclease [Bdellovibrionota bacterium]
MKFNKLDFVVVDVETTGISPKHGHRVVEVAAIRLDSQARPIDSYTSLINPEGRVGPTHIHGIQQEDVEGAPIFDEIAGDIVQILKGAVFVAHNVWFDYRFLRSEFSNYGYIIPDIPQLCTLQLARKLLPELPSKKLGSCCQYFDINLESAHSAFDDALATGELLAELLKIAKRKDLDLQDLKLKNIENLKHAFPSVTPSNLAVYRPGYGSFVEKTQSKFRNQAKSRKLRSDSKKTIKLKNDTTFTDNLIINSAKKRRAKRYRKYFEALDFAMINRKVNQEELNQVQKAAAEEGLSDLDAVKLNERWFDKVMDQAGDIKRLDTRRKAELSELRSLLGI